MGWRDLGKSRKKKKKKTLVCTLHPYGWALNLIRELSEGNPERSCARATLPLGPLSLGSSWMPVNHQRASNVSSINIDRAYTDHFLIPDLK